MWRNLLALLVVLLLSPLALADGLIVIHEPPHPIPGHFRFAPLEVAYHRVNVDIQDNIATTSIDQEFRNPSDMRLEGTYIFPLPEGAHIDKFSMDIGGKMQDAELLDAAKARSLYEEIVRRQRDPALLEYVGRGAFKVRIFPIEPNSRKQIKIRYTQLLKSNDGLTEYVYPLNTEKFSSRPLEEVSVKVNVRSSRPLKTIYCPTHEVELRRSGDRGATAGFEQRNVRPDTDFRLVFSEESKPLDIRLLTTSRRGEDGYFLLMASPGLSDREDLQPKDICFVIDTSGSMAGEKIKQAKKAIRFCIDNLNPSDRFQVIRFSTEAQPLWGELMKATTSAREKAGEFVDTFKPLGGTAISDAMREAMKYRDGRENKSRPYMVVFLTDGQPTVGETNEDKLVDIASNDGRTRIFCFGIGDDINTHLLDRVADKTNAFSTYVGAKEDLEVKVSSFFTGISSPMLTGVELAMSGVRTYDVMPRVMPDLFRGQTLYVFGRYSGSGHGAAALSGAINGEKRRFAEDVTFTDDDTSHVFVAQLWATRRVGWLLDEIRLHGESTELKEEVTRLAREFGIVTPYTAYLILEDEQRRNVPVPMQTMRELSMDRDVRRRVDSYYSSNNMSSGQIARGGGQGVANAKAMQELKQAETLTTPAASASPAMEKPGVGGPALGTGYRFANNYAQQAKFVNGRAFYQNGTVWTDANAQRSANARQQAVKFGSAEYFALAQRNRDVAAWLSLGNEVDVLFEGVLYQVRE